MWRKAVWGPCAGFHVLAALLMDFNISDPTFTWSSQRPPGMNVLLGRSIIRGAACHVQFPSCRAASRFVKKPNVTAECNQF
jgi:hypothetical protein